MTFIKTGNLKRKVLAVLLSLTLVINLLSPLFLSGNVYAQEAASESEQAAQSESSEPQAPTEETSPAEESSSETSSEASPVPGEESATPSEEPILEEPVLIVEPTEEPAITPTGEEAQSDTDAVDAVAEEEAAETSADTQDPVVADPSEEPALDAESAPVAEPSATPVPTPIPVWADLGDKSYETSGNLEINKEYVAPQNDKVKIAFNVLPEASGKLTIKEIKLTAEQIAQMGALSDTAYDITSTMQDGTFEYDLTLPLPANTQAADVEVKSAENSNLSDAQEVTEPKEEKSPDTITIKGLNHFTVFVITAPTPDTTQRVLINEIVPTATAEWVELFNNGTASVNLANGTGWVIRNSAGVSQSLSGLGTVAPAGRAVFNAPAGFLSNVAPETVTILNELGATIDTVTVSLTAPGFAIDHYPTATESVGRKTDGVNEWFIFATPSKGTANVIPQTGGAGSLSEVGLVSATTTFPAWYRDSNGITVDLMEAADTNGISAPVDANPFSQQVGFSAEGFYWSADASLGTFMGTDPVTGNPIAGNALLVQAIEAGFAPAETAVDGNQSVFARVRIRVDVNEPGTYVVTYPYGQKTYNIAAADVGTRAINDTVDIGCFDKASCNAQVLPFSGALNGGIGPLLTWTTFNSDSALTDPALNIAGRRYVGVVGAEHAVTGSPTGNNFFRITGPNIGGIGVNTIETTLFTVTGRLADAAAPVITLHGANPVNAVQGSTYVDAGATALDDQGGNLTGSIVITGLPLDTATLGAKTVTYTVIDGAGRTATATRTVNVVAAGGVDATAPVITLLGTSPVSVVRGTVYTDAGATALDNFDGDVTAGIATASTVNTAAIGAYTVTYNVSDAAGNAATPVVRNVNVVADTVAPVITITGSNPVNVLTGASYTDAGATATDNVDGNVTANIAVTGLPINTAISQDNTVTYTVTDSVGNTATATRTVHVANTLPAGLVQVGAVSPTTTFPLWYKDSNGIALDLMPAADTNGISAPVDQANPFSQQVGFGAEGFWFSADASMALGDGTSALLVQAVEAAFAPAETAVDGNQSAFARVRIRFNTPTTGTYTVIFPYGTRTYNVTELVPGFEVNDTVDIGCFDKASCNAQVLPFSGALAGEVGPYVTWDTFNTNPDLSDPALINSATGRRYIGKPGSHAIKGSPTGNNKFRIDGPNIGGAGINFVETTLFEVTGRLADVTAPVITLNGLNPVDVTQNAVYTDAGATANDNFDGIVAVVTTGLPIDTSIVGPKTVTYTATDRSGNTATATRTVNVTGVDNTVPVITLLGTSPVSVIRGTVYADAGATATDNLDGNITANILTTGLPVNTSAIGTFTVIYNVSDVAGNAATPVTRTVNVVADTVAPVITRLGINPESVVVGNPYTDAGATATDNVDGNISANIVTVNPVNTAIVGVYTVIYNVTDAAGNPATQVTRTVNVTAAPDVTAPVITMLGASPVDITVGGVYTDAGATALDNIDGNITANIATTNLVNAAVVGNYTVTYNVSDASGNQATPVVRTVNVNAAPALAAITVPSVPTITGTTQVFTATTLDQFNNPIVAAVSFTSSNPSVGTINPSTGVFTAIGTGTTIITAISGAITGSVLATVQSTATAAVLSPTNPTVGIGGSMQFTAPVTDQFGASVNNPVTFSSSNPLVGSIDPITGIFTPLLPGVTTITVSSGAVSNTTLVTVSVAVTSADLASVNVSAPTNLTSVGGANIQLTASPVAQNGAVITTGITTTFVSNNTAVATVNNAGVVTPVAAGKTTIRVTSTNGTTTVKKDVNITVEVSVESTNLASLVTGQVFQPAGNSGPGSTPSITVASPVAINIADVGGKNHKVRIPQGTVITRIDGAMINANSISATIPASGDISGFIAGATINGALQWGINNIGLAFAGTPVTLDINVGVEFNGQTLSVSRSTSGNSAWTTDGIVNPTCVVANGMCSFQITKASFFAAYTSAQESASSGSSSSGSSTGDGRSDGLGCSVNDCSGNTVSPTQTTSAILAQAFVPGFAEEVLGASEEESVLTDLTVEPEKESQELAQNTLGAQDDTQATAKGRNNTLAISIISVLALILTFAGFKIFRRKSDLV